jgi:hypothetical protein
VARVHRQKLGHIDQKISLLLNTKVHSTVDGANDIVGNVNNSYCGESEKVPPLISYSDQKRKNKKSKVRGGSNGNIVIKVKP